MTFVNETCTRLDRMQLWLKKSEIFWSYFGMKLTLRKTNRLNPATRRRTWGQIVYVFGRKTSALNTTPMPYPPVKCWPNFINRTIHRSQKKNLIFFSFFFSPPEYAAEFVLTLASNSTYDDKRALFGKHVRLLHESCQSKLLHFTKKAHASGKNISFPPPSEE